MVPLLFCSTLQKSIIDRHAQHWIVHNHDILDDKRLCLFETHPPHPLAEQDLSSSVVSSFPEQHHASVNGHGKRQDDEIVIRRSVRATYICPIGGQQNRDFRWEERYDCMTGIAQLNGLEHIQSFNHVLVATNNFKTQFLNKFPQLHDNFATCIPSRGPS